MISSTSRYADSNLVVISKGDADVQVIVPSAPQSFTFSYAFHVVTGNERLDRLSYAFYSDPTLWWKFADANPEIMNWLDLKPATTIRIPNS